MKYIRKGNDITVRWSFLRGEDAFQLEDLDVRIFLKNAYGKQELDDFTLSGNTVQWTFYGKDQKNTGKFSLEIVVNEGKPGMITTDICDFVNIVSSTSQLSNDKDAPNVETESVEITSNLEEVAGVGSEPYDDTAIWNELHKKLESETFTTTEPTEDILCCYDDTGIKQQINELSEELSGLTERVDDIEKAGGGSMPDASDYLTKQEFNEAAESFARADALKGKQDTIEDLEQIRSGAEKGATAVQSTDLNNYATIHQLTELSEYVEETVSQIDGSNAPYIPEFTLLDIYNAKEHKTNFQVDTMSLFGAVQQKKTILIRESLDLPSLYVCSYLQDDLLYIRIFATGEVINCEFASPTEAELRWENINITPLYGELMLATPSGDPMHYMYEEAGAVFNSTDEDIAKEGMYGDTIYHYAGRWYLNEIGDLTNENMRAIVHQNQHCDSRYWARIFAGLQCRTNVPFHWYGKKGFVQMVDINRFTNGAMEMECETLLLPPFAQNEYALLTSPASAFYNSQKLRKILNPFIFNDAPTTACFSNCYALEEFRLRDIKFSLDFSSCSKLSNETILYMILNEAASEVITLTLHPDVYNRAMTDAVIIDELGAHENVTLSY